MKKITESQLQVLLDNKQYNPDEAVPLHSHDTQEYRNDRYGNEICYYNSKTLYRTESGNYFIHHLAGIMGRTIDHEYHQAITDDFAYHFLKTHSYNDNAQTIIARYFGDRITDARNTRQRG